MLLSGEARLPEMAARLGRKSETLCRLSQQRVYRKFVPVVQFAGTIPDILNFYHSAWILTWH
jgi:hypothetical protein